MPKRHFKLRKHPFSNKRKKGRLSILAPTLFSFSFIFSLFMHCTLELEQQDKETGGAAQGQWTFMLIGASKWNPFRHPSASSSTSYYLIFSYRSFLLLCIVLKHSQPIRFIIPSISSEILKSIGLKIYQKISPTSCLYVLYQPSRFEYSQLYQILEAIGKFR